MEATDLHELKPTRTRTRTGLASIRLCSGALVATDLHELKPTLESWVPHIAVFILPRQILALGDPTRRSCDACESFGARLKKVIKLLTCRRHRASTVTHNRRSDLRSDQDRRKEKWTQTFSKGYIQQAFTRVTVSERLRHGEDNARFLQRVDARRLQTGRDSVKNEKKAAEVKPKVRELMEREAEVNMS